jgi:hypothetical protein
VRAVYWMIDDLNQRGHSVARVGSRADGRYVMMG